MRVVARSWVRDAPGAANKDVTKVIRQHLQSVCTEIGVVPQEMVVGWAARSLLRVKNNIKWCEKKTKTKKQ